MIFVGSVGGFERPLVEESGVDFAHYAQLYAGPMHGVGARQVVISLVKNMVGTLQAFALMIRKRPRALLLTGGWVSLPAALAAWVLRVPSLIYLPDIEPGLAIKVLRRFVTQVATTTDDSHRFFRRGHAVTTGYPLRADVQDATRDAGIDHFGLNPNQPTLLVFGGSRGARSINTVLVEIAPELVAEGIQIIHVTGTLDYEQVQARREAVFASSDNGRDNYHIFAYLHSAMGLAFACADLVVCRAGASTLGELPQFALPAILVPYPHAWRYQKVNADYLAAHGAALVLRDEDMPDRLLPAIRDLFDDTARLADMRAAAAALAVPDGAGNVARELLRLAGETV